MHVSYFLINTQDCVKIVGSCVLKAFVDRVSVDTIGRYGDRLSADISTDTRPICRPRLGRALVDMNRQACRLTPGRYFTATRPPLSRHLAATQMPLGWYFTNTRPTLSSPGQLLLPPEFYLPCSTERLSVAVVLFWPLTPAIFKSFFLIGFIYDPRYFRMQQHLGIVAFGGSLF